jgi:cyclic-di-GMP-binding biofilm dispersal mediator protein
MPQQWRGTRNPGRAAGTLVIMAHLTDAHVLVVGATGGLGTAIVRGLARSGARLTLSGRSGDRLDQLAAELGDQAVATAAADITVPDAPDQLMRNAYASLGRLDGVVYAAGVVAFGEVADLDDDVLDQLVLVNLLAPIRLTRAAAQVLPTGGFVATLSAVVAEQPQKGMAAYSATKAGLTAFDRAAAAELRRRQIRVIDIRPTHTETGLASRPIAGQSPRLPTGASPANVADRIVAAILNDEKDLPAAAFTG